MNTESIASALAQAHSHEDWVRSLAHYFDAHGLHYGHGTDNASDEAYWLVRSLQDWRDDLWESPPDPALIERVVTQAVLRVTTRAPLAYLLGEAWFAGLRFKIDRRVLIPRSPLAELIEARFEPWCRLRPGDRLLEVGTGSGCIAIAAAYHCDNIWVDATDVSVEALAVAVENVATHQLADRIQLIEADLFPSVPNRYRVIISNPPYVPAGELSGLPAEYQHEPAVAFVGGADGLEPTRRLLAAAGAWLEPDGVLIVEVGNAADALMQMYPDLPAVWVEFERGGTGVFVLTADDLAQLDFSDGQNG